MHKIYYKIDKMRACLTSCPFKKKKKNKDEIFKVGSWGESDNCCYYDKSTPSRAGYILCNHSSLFEIKLKFVKELLK